ncbi:LacI family DNA-binding transcriptional regulator [Actinospica sp.]|uniref:LacI family DNA-binding transcriptional regulator n=1 Tax=Actinospica sp. TaxID=1872142 RepID=UPI002CCC51CC|nr:LacI family DNA-binding transcriptional regulator [Actinospica sp.]HWG25613.1 LacI family DNA-binding transcriptional regulator [Actinospica sp.]
MLRRTVGIKDVAREAGVSVGTVSNVINRPDTVARATRERVQEVVRHLGYVRSESARQLRAGASRIVGLLVLDMGNPFFVDVARGAERAARAAGLGVMVCNSASSPDEEAEYLSMFVEQRVRGVLVTPADPTGRDLDLLRRHGIPYVVVDAIVDDTEDGGGSCSVSVDDVAGGEMAVAHLLAQGHRSIAFVSGVGHGRPQIRDRWKGACRAVALAGLAPETVREILPDVAASIGADAVARLLDLPDRPTAVFCANDMLALGVLQALFAAGIKVPEEIALVGYDDIQFAAAAAVPLTSVRQPAAEMGRIAAEMLVRESAADHDVEGHAHRHVVLQPELVARASSSLRVAP